jgi:adenylate cyclase
VSGGTSVRLEVVEGDGAGTAHVLTGISVIGRDAGCAVVINHRAVSREHAVIRPEEGFGFVLEDLDSRAGTFVNGMRTRKAVLQDGDLIRVGGSTLRVRVATASLRGEVLPENVEQVKTRFMPTARLTLDAVKIRSGLRKIVDLDEPAVAPATPVDEDDRPTARLTAAQAAADDDEADDEAPPPDEAPLHVPATSPVEPLGLLCDIAASIATIQDPTRLNRETALRIFGLLPQARRIGFFELEDEAQGGDPVLRPRYLVDRTARERGSRVQVSQTALQAAISGREAILSQDVTADPRFRLTTSAEDAGIRSIICVPLGISDRIVGALYLDAEGPAPFDERSLRLATGVAAILAAAFENARLFGRIQAETVRRSNLERYFSPDLVERALKGDLPKARQGGLAQGTFLFVDIRGFSRLTETTPPPVLVATLNAYFAAMQRIIFRGGGTVERFGGDSILSYWGVVDIDAKGPLRASRAALAMQVEAFRLNPELVEAGRPPIKIAIGVNSGEVIAGDVGSPERYEFTILGDAVNLARRIEGNALAWEVLVGPATIEHLGAFALRLPLPPITVKGKSQPVALSLLYGLRVEQPARGDARWDLALLGTLDIGLGAGPLEVLASGIEVHGKRVLLEVLTEQDPIPGTATRLMLSLPRVQEKVAAVTRVRGASADDTISLSMGMASLKGLQRILLEVDDPRALLGSLGVPL